MTGASKSPPAAAGKVRNAAKKAAKKRKRQSGSWGDTDKVVIVDAVETDLERLSDTPDSDTENMDDRDNMDDVPDMDDMDDMFRRYIAKNRNIVLDMLIDSSRWEEEMRFESDIRDELKTIKDQNQDLKKKLSIALGTITRLESKVESLTAKTTDLTERSMRDNVIIKNMDEDQDENLNTITRNVLDYFERELNIAASDMENVRIERAHRMGKPVRGRNRHIVVKLNSRGKDIAMKHLRNLNRNCPIRMSDQHPPEVHANRDKLWPLYSKARDEGRKAKWISDQLLVDGKIYKPTKDKVADINLDVTEKAATMTPKHTAITTKDESSFQAHIVPVKSKDDIIPAVKALGADTRIAGATHVMYAYRVGSERHSIHNWEDDGEWGGGRWIMEAIAQRGVYNQLICITRWHNGKNLGKLRFEVIKELANDVITAIQ